MATAEHRHFVLIFTDSSWPEFYKAQSIPYQRNSVHKVAVLSFQLLCSPIQIQTKSPDQQGTLMNKYRPTSSETQHSLVLVPNGANVYKLVQKCIQICSLQCATFTIVHNYKSPLYLNILCDCYTLVSYKPGSKVMHTAVCCM